MTLRVPRKSLSGFCILFVLIAGIVPLSAQHVTLDDTILTRPPKAILEALKQFEPYDSRNFELKVKMIRALGKKGYSFATPQLLQTLNEGRTRIARMNNRPLDYWKVRAESALALGRIGDAKAVPQLAEAAFRDKDIYVRICAIRALGMLKSTDAVPRLMDMLEKTTIDRVANELVKTLGEIGDKRAFPILLSVTQRNFSQEVRKNALLAIRKINWNN